MLNDGSDQYCFIQLVCFFPIYQLNLLARRVGLCIIKKKKKGVRTQVVDAGVMSVKENIHVKSNNVSERC